MKAKDCKKNCSIKERFILVSTSTRAQMTLTMLSASLVSGRRDCFSGRLMYAGVTPP